MKVLKSIAPALLSLFSLNCYAAAVFDSQSNVLQLPVTDAGSAGLFAVSLQLLNREPLQFTISHISALNDTTAAVDARYDSNAQILDVPAVQVDDLRLSVQLNLIPLGDGIGFQLLSVQTLSNGADCGGYLGAFSPYLAQVNASCDDAYLYIDTPTGLPDLSEDNIHLRPMVDISAWILRVPIPYHYEWKIPRQPQWLHDHPTGYEEASPKGPIAVAVDGVPIFHYERRPDVSTDPSVYDPRSDTVLQGELDQCGGHAGQGDDYHYHYAPVCLLAKHDVSQPIAFGLDGIPVYFGTGGTDYYGSGLFNEINNLPAHELDDCNALAQGEAYVYYTTATPPYVIGCHRAAVDAGLKIEPRPMDERRQGDAAPYGGEFGEPSTTVVTDFYQDEHGHYHLEHQAFDGNGSSAVIYSPTETNSDKRECWNFEYREELSSAGSSQTVCR